MCDNLEEIQAKFNKASKDLENAKKLKINEENKKFTDAVNENLEQFNKIKLQLGNIDENENVCQLAEGLNNLTHVRNTCRKYDYDDNPYGTFSIGPDKAHEVNSKVISGSEALKKCVKNRIMYLLTTFKWERA